MFLNYLIGLFSYDMGIDLGTANTLVLVKDKGVVIDEPSVVAVYEDRKANKIRTLAVGKEAKEMLGKTPAGITAMKPMRDGVIADFDVTEKMIKYFIEKAHKRSSFLRPRVLISVPYGLTQVERKAVRESTLSAGAREVFLMEEPMAAAIGAKLPIQEARGSLVVDIGGGTTEIGVIALGGLVHAKSIRTAGDKLDLAIENFIKEKYNLQIGGRGEEIKIKIGSAMPLAQELTMVAKGKDQIKGLVNRIEVTSEDVREAMREPLKEIADALKFVLEHTSAELASDIIESGVVLTGGGALIRGIDKYLSDIVKLPVYVADDPLLAVSRGTGEVLGKMHLLRDLGTEY